ncbi:2-oxo acid dehydrogenase subunit E2 [Nonomuraea sp. PA05]|uniref:dihydrolipoamide acetyltransferase family protein n=1 Tax=Nonomuraea sp. PA05 TaxID=2604466 RepID=UPI0011D68314|nr:dihydrolipoamide acetyltransferase family protein [Nonomuraea sp. PA05]TYB50309.1 2-oxo acid dehydrogenase subunit E2 [Nonomuraea sp. PA05]
MNTLEAQLFRLPDLGEGLAEAEVVVWKVAVGDRVEVDQIVVEVETAKAAVEVPVPFAGVVVGLHAAAGTTLSVGDPLISVGGAGGSGGPGGASGVRTGGASGVRTGGASGVRTGGASGVRTGGASGVRTGGAPDGAAERYREEERAGSGNVLIGYGTGHLSGQRRRRRDRTGSGPSASPSAGLAAVAPREEAPRVISPLVRRLAQENGVDLAGVTPSGPNRVILRRDVERAIAEHQNVPAASAPRQTAASAPQQPAASAPRQTTASAPQQPAASAPRQTAASAPQQPAASAPQQAAPSAPQEAERIPLRGLRRAVAEKLSRSRSEIPDATTWVDADATALLETRDALRAAVPDRRIGLLALLARICVAGLRRYPELNSTVDLDHAEIVRYPQIHLGFAAQTGRGLVVPVVRDAHLLTLSELAAELARLTALAREGTLPPQSLTGGTFTLNNYGVFGVDGSTPIINHPEAALLGVGRVIDRPWAVDGTLAIRKITQLSFTFDHRVCDGGVAGGFLRYVADCVERPATLLADL